MAKRKVKSSGKKGELRRQKRMLERLRRLTKKDLEVIDGGKSKPRIPEQRERYSPRQVQAAARGYCFDHPCFAPRIDSDSLVNPDCVLYRLACDGKEGPPTREYRGGDVRWRGGYWKNEEVVRKLREEGHLK